MSFWGPVVRGAVCIGVRSEMRIGVRIEVVPPSAFIGDANAPALLGALRCRAASSEVGGRRTGGDR
ncbi:hypothetical protein [Streptomyces sp. NPDC002221]|uniref:hypothetical protein n=1 Tax=Streptomyces sp. NPDC002221 TaxID=3364639 RepID=UPI00369E4657